MSGAPPQVVVTPSATGTTINTLPSSNPAGTSDTVALPVQGVTGGVPVPISAAVLPLPAGAAADGTDASGVTAPTGGVGIRGWLSGIYSVLKNGSVAVTGSFYPATQPVSAASLPLPSGAAQDGADGTGITPPTGAAGIRGWLSGIYKLLSGSIAVTGTFWQATQPISASSLPLPTGAATAAGLTTINTTLGSPAQDGTDATGVTAPTGGVGIRGWLSGIYKFVSQFAFDGSGNLKVNVVTGAGGGSSGAGGNLNTQKTLNPAVTASAYTSGYCLGGLMTFPVFHNASNPSGLLNQFAAFSKTGLTAQLTVFIFTKSPNSTATDHAAFSLNTADLANLVVPPFLLAPVVLGVGSTTSSASQSFSVSTVNQDSTLTENLYVVIATAAVTPASTTEFFFSMNVVADY